MDNFPTLFDWLERLEFLRGLPAAYIVLGAALLIVALTDWRLSVLALTVQYMAASLLFVEVLEPRLAIVKLFVGIFICLMLYFAGRQVETRRLVAAPAPSGSRLRRLRQELREGLRQNLLRLLLAVIGALLVLVIVGRPGYQLPAVPEPLNLAIFALGGMGLLAVALAQTPLQTGMGLLLFLTGFELFINTLDQSAEMLILLAAINLTLTIGISYLAQVQRALPVAE